MKSTMQKKRKYNKKEVHPIEGSRSFHVIAVDHEGTFTTIKHLQDINIVEKIKVGPVVPDVSAEGPEDKDTDDWDERLRLDTFFELVDPGTFIAIRKVGNSSILQQL